MFIDSSTYRLLLDNRKLFTADQARGKTFNNKQQHSISRKALPRIHEEEKQEKTKKNKRIVNQTNLFLLLYLIILSYSRKRKKTKFFLASTRTFAKSAENPVLDTVDFLLQILFLENSSQKSLQSQVQNSQQKAKERSFHQIK